MSDETKIVIEKPIEPLELTEFEKEVLTLGHLLKYNLYLLSKAVVFQALAGVVSKETTGEELADYAHTVLERFHRQDHPQKKDI
jgi:hypothetical protein